MLAGYHQTMCAARACVRACVVFVHTAVHSFPQPATIRLLGVGIYIIIRHAVASVAAPHHVRAVLTPSSLMIDGDCHHDGDVGSTLVVADG